MLRIVPLGGLGEIGLNSMVVEFAGEQLLVDAGLLFPHAGEPGVNAILPDFSYVRASPGALKGILLTHGHEDHVGALASLLEEINVPVYGAPFTLALVRHRLEEQEIKADLREIGPGESIPLGEHFRFEGVRTCHSMPDALGYLIQTPWGTVAHTGDYKVDENAPDGRNTDLTRYGEAGDQGILCLLADSTNSESMRPTGSESTVASALDRVMAEAGDGALVVSMFASNILRLQAVFDASAKLGRRVVLGGRSMVRNVELARGLGLLKFAPDAVVSMDTAATLPRRALTILSTGSQGEPRSGLVQLLNDERPLHLVPGDAVILSARPIPGNERVVAALMDSMAARGARVIHAGPVPDLHVSGHASPDQQRQLIQACRPENFVPIHGELHHLHAQLATARAVGVRPQGLCLARDGDIISFDSGRALVNERTHAGRRYRDLFGQGWLTPDAISERIRIAETGVIVAAVVVDGSGRIVGGPTFEGRGLAMEELAHFPKAGEAVLRELQSVSTQLLADEAFLKFELAAAVRKVFRTVSGKRAAVVPVVVRS
ncbi:MAG: ribonuclease J [Myxococcota bacterium]|nr:ribonuclease J [Myxococcota bacterium]